MAGDARTFIQIVIAGSLGGISRLAGQWVSKRTETKPQRELRDPNRAEAVYDRRVDFELRRLEKLRMALVAANAVAENGRRL